MPRIGESHIFKHLPSSMQCRREPSSTTCGSSVDSILTRSTPCFAIVVHLATLPSLLTDGHSKKPASKLNYHDGPIFDSREIIDRPPIRLPCPPWHAPCHWSMAWEGRTRRTFRLKLKLRILCHRRLRLPGSRVLRPNFETYDRIRLSSF